VAAITTPNKGRSAGVDAARAIVARVAVYVVLVVVAAYFAVPMLWLLTAPFNAGESLSVGLAHPTLHNFVLVFRDPQALRALINSVIYSVATMVLATVFAATAAYALSRVAVPGRTGLLFGLLLLSSVVSGSAAIVPLYVIASDMKLVDTMVGVVLVLTAGLIPAAIFILKEFMDGTPASYEESARIFGASPFQILKDIVAPVVRSGLAVVAVWAFVNAWSNFLIPFILLNGGAANLVPASVEINAYQTSGGETQLATLSAFSFLYAIPVIVLYIIVNRRYGFRFYGGLKQ
jgi:multiple sugar transport system permease protein